MSERGWRIFGTLTERYPKIFGLSSGIFGTKFWKILKKICGNQSGKWGFLEASAGTQKLLKPLQKPLIWGVVKKF